MESIFKNLRSLHFAHYVGVSDFSDKLHFLLTPSLLMFASALVTIRTYFMVPIVCYMPSMLSNTRTLDMYTSQYCMVEGVYAVDLAEFSLVNNSDSRYRDRKITYYLWVPVVLAVQAICFCLPRALWHLVSFDKAGTDVGRIVRTADEAEKLTDSDKRKQLLTHVARQLKRLRPPAQRRRMEAWLRKRRCQGCKQTNPPGDSGPDSESSDEQSALDCDQPDLSAGPSQTEAGTLPARNVGLFACGTDSLKELRGTKSRPTMRQAMKGKIKGKMNGRIKRLLGRLVPSRLIGGSIMFSYFLVKLAYLLNVVLQLVLTNKFLHLKSIAFGLQLLVNVTTGVDWQNSLTFPRVGCCSVRLRAATAEPHLFMAQCVLPVNIFNEKIFLIMWFWYTFLAAIAVVSTMKWTMRLFSKLARPKFVRSYLKLADNYKELKASQKQEIRQFADNFIGADGAFLLHMIAINCGDLACADVLKILWEDFTHEERCAEKKGILMCNCDGLRRHRMSAPAVMSRSASETSLSASRATPRNLVLAAREKLAKL